MKRDGETNFSEFCSPGAAADEKLVSVTDQVSLRMITFTPAQDMGNPPILFVAGLISQITGWKKVLHEMTRDFKVYYVETREKFSSIANGPVEYSVEEIGKDLVLLISILHFRSQQYILFGSSLGATAILDSYRFLKQTPLCLVLVGPNAIFRIPKWSYPIIWVFPPRLYLLIKPIIRWYVRMFELDVKSDAAQYQKYSNALDVADPWKLKKLAIPLARYRVWDRLDDIDCPTLIVGASKDIMHIPENLFEMTDRISNATYLDMETNSQTHSADMVHEVRKYISTLNNG